MTCRPRCTAVAGSGGVCSSALRASRSWCSAATSVSGPSRGRSSTTATRAATPRKKTGTCQRWRGAVVRAESVAMATPSVGRVHRRRRLWHIPGEGVKMKKLTAENAEGRGEETSSPRPSAFSAVNFFLLEEQIRLPADPLGAGPELLERPVLDLADPLLGDAEQ